MEIRRRVVPTHVYNAPDHAVSNFASESSDTTSSEPAFPANPVSILQWMLIISCLVLAVVLVPVSRQPCLQKFSSLEKPVNNSFQEKFARQHLKFVTGVGPRTGGSINNEIHTRNYLRSKLEELTQKANAVSLDAVLDEQICNPSSFKTHAHITTYANLHNLIFRLHDPRVSRTKEVRAVLVNCHYDSAVGSPGASDAFVSCANAIEVIRVLANGETSLVNDIIFLFNSAEEFMLPASHAFITQHRWAKDVAAFVNLEGAGAGGKLLVFQSGPGPAGSTLIDLYSRGAAQPSANVIGEEVFQFGLIPSDTDFRIFRDYGMLPGLDLAYISDGYSYHTCHDIEERISASCLQLAGENLLNIIILMAGDARISDIEALHSTKNITEIDSTILFSPEGGFASIHEHSVGARHGNSRRSVYFDVSGYFMVQYPWWIGRIIHYIVCFCCLASVLPSKSMLASRNASVYGLVLAVIIQVLFLVSGLLFVLGLGYVTHLFGCRISWYSNRYNLFGLFLLPLFTFCAFFHTLFFSLHQSSMFSFFPFRVLLQKSLWTGGSSDRQSLNMESIENDFFKGNLLLVNVPFILTLILDSPASYVIMLWCVFVFTFRWIYLQVRKIIGTNFVIRSFLLLLPPLLVFHISTCALLFDVFIPIFGRAGHLPKPDVTMGALVFLVSWPIFLFLCDLLHLTSRKSARTFRYLLFNACITFAVLVNTSSVGFPYTTMPTSNAHLVSPSQQRVALFHANRNFRNNPLHPTVTHSDSGIFMLPLDVNEFRYFLSPPSLTTLSDQFVSRVRQFVAFGVSEVAEFPELSVLDPFPLQSDLPYCGVPLLYPLLHAFRTLYYLSAEPHKSPGPELTILNREISPGFNENFRTVNLTLSVSSFAPYTLLFLRSQPRNVRLLNWSFAPEAGTPKPVALPARNLKDPKLLPSAHFYVSHIDPSPATSGGLWSTPWTFWLQFAIEPDSQNAVRTESCMDCVDVALVAQYLDVNVTYGTTPELLSVLNRLPGWVVPSSWVSSYEHWRISLLTM